MVATVTASPVSATVSAATSSAVSARRASPEDSRTSRSTASVPTRIPPPSPRGSLMACVTTVRMSSAANGCNCRISDRDSNGATTENDGFSVVAATSRTMRFSTAASSASCWVFENRCTSSMNSTVCSPWAAARRAVSMTARTSLTPADTADSASNRRPVACEINDASVVLPVPGGPYRMTDAAPEPSTSRRSGDPGCSKWDCPTTSSSDAGRIRTASGADTPRPRPCRSAESLVPGRAKRPATSSDTGAAGPATSDTVSGIPRRFGGRSRLGLRHEVDELLDPADQRRLEVVPVPDAGSDPPPRRGDVRLVCVRPSHGITQAVLPVHAARHVGPLVKAHPGRLDRLPDVDERMPDHHRMRAVWSPADGVGKAGFLRTGDEVVDEHAESARGPRPELLDDVDEIVDAAQPLDHHALDPQVVPPDLLDELRVVPSLDVDAAGHRDACPPRRHRDRTRRRARR